MDNKINIAGEEYHLTPEAYKGAVDTGLLRKEGVLIGGWVTKTDSANVDYVIAMKDGQIVHRFAVDKTRDDIANALGSDKLKSGFREVVALDHDSTKALRFFAIGGDRTAALIAIYTKNYFLDRDRVRPDELRQLIQDPAIRIGDKQTLTYFARKFFSENAAQFNLAAPCLCVIGYRALETQDPEHPDLSYCLTEGSKLLEQVGPIDDRATYRWFISVNLMLGFMSALCGQRDRAGVYFKSIVEQAGEIEIMPQMITNILKATYFLGRVYEAGDNLEGALETWNSALPTFRRAAPLWTFENYYSYAELAQSTYLAQECYGSHLRLMIKLGKAATNPALAPADLKINFSCLGFPGADFCRKGLL